MKTGKVNKTILIATAVIVILLGGTAVVSGRWKDGGKDPEPGKEEKLVYGTVMDESAIGIPTGDDPWKETEQLVAAYYGGDQQIAYTGKMKLWDDNTDKQKLLEEHLFDYSFFRGQYYYKMGPIECVGKHKFLLLVNHGDKTVSVSTVVPGADKGGLMMNMDKFKQLMTESKADAKVTQTGSEKIITVNNLSDPTVQGYQVYYDPVSYRVHKILVGMIRFSPLDNEEQVEAGQKTEEVGTENKETEPGEFVDGYSYVLEIIYEKARLTPMTEKEFNPENKFIRSNGKHFELAEAYKNYQLTN